MYLGLLIKCDGNKSFSLVLNDILIFMLILLGFKIDFRRYSEIEIMGSS